MTERRRYTKRQKATVVVAAEMTSVAAAAEAAGIPETTVAYWFDAPEFVELRAKTREDLAEETNTLAHKVLGKISARLDQFDPKDLAILYGILTDKGQLLSGQATSRAEVAITEGWQDHERQALRDAIAAELASREEVEA